MKPKIKDFEILVGDWQFESPDFPGGRGEASFEWIEDSAYLLHKSNAPDPAPNSTWIIGLDDTSGKFYALYHDSRGDARVYLMSLANSVWKIWRDAPGFCQRFTGKMSEDKNTINASWESSPDGKTWQRDFGLVYKRKFGSLA